MIDYSFINVFFLEISSHPQAQEQMVLLAVFVSMVVFVLLIGAVVALCFKRLIRYVETSTSMFCFVIQCI